MKSFVAWSTFLCRRSQALNARVGYGRLEWGIASKRAASLGGITVYHHNSCIRRRSEHMAGVEKIRVHTLG
jgi:hypothetical protein